MFNQFKSRSIKNYSKELPQPNSMSLILSILSNLSVNKLRAWDNKQLIVFCPSYILKTTTCSNIIDLWDNLTLKLLGFTYVAITNGGTGPIEQNVPIDTNQS